MIHLKAFYPDLRSLTLAELYGDYDFPIEFKDLTLNTLKVLFMGLHKYVYKSNMLTVNRFIITAPN